MSCKERDCFAALLEQEGNPLVDRQLLSQDEEGRRQPMMGEQPVPELSLSPAAAHGG